MPCKHQVAGSIPARGSKCEGVMIDINDVLNGTFSQIRRYDCSPGLYDQIVFELEMTQMDYEQIDNIARFLDQSAADLARRVLKKINFTKKSSIGYANLKLLVEAGVFKKFLMRIMKPEHDKKEV